MLVSLREISLVECLKICAVAQIKSIAFVEMESVVFAYVSNKIKELDKRNACLI